MSPLTFPLRVSLGPSTELVKNSYNILRQPNAVAFSYRNLDQDVSVNKAVDSDLGVDGRNTKLSCSGGAVNNWLAKEGVHESVGRGVSPCLNAVAPLRPDGFEVLDEDTTIVNCRERCLSDGADYRCDVPGAVSTEGIKITAGVLEQTRGDRNSDIARQLPPAQHRLDQCSTDSAIAIGEWVDRFELGMGDRGLNKNGQVEAIGETDKIVHECGDSLVMGRDELCGVGPKAPPSDPQLLIVPTANDVGVALLEQRAVHLQDGVAINGFGQGESGLHGSDVAYDQLRIPRGVLTELRQRDLSRAAG